MAGDQLGSKLGSCTRIFLSQDETVFTAAATLLRDREAKHRVSADRSGTEEGERVGSSNKGACEQERGVVHENLQK